MLECILCIINTFIVVCRNVFLKQSNHEYNSVNILNNNQKYMNTKLLQIV